MKPVNSSYSSSSLLHIMIPQFHSLLPVESVVSGNWSNPPRSSENTSSPNTSSSPPISITPSSVCTDFSENDYHPVDLSFNRKYSLSTPPLSNIKSESIDSTDLCSPLPKTESMMTTSRDEKPLPDQHKPLKKRSNFTIEHLLATSYPPAPTYHFLNRSSRPVQSIFNKKKTKHFSDHFLHRIVHHRKRCKSEMNKSLSAHIGQTPREKFIGYILDLVKDLVHQQSNQIGHGEKFFHSDALEQLAEIACKLDTRQRRSIFDADDPLNSKTYQNLLKQCHHLVKQIDQKYQQKKLPKRLDSDSKSNFKRHMVHFPISVLNLLQMKKNSIADQSNHHSDCYTSTPSDNSEHLNVDQNTPTKKSSSMCSHLQAEEISPNMEILLPNNDLVYEAIVQTIDQHDDLFLIRLNHERQNYLIPIHDLCRLACPKRIPTDLHMLEKGSRVCAYWSTSLRGLHPAVVTRMPTDMNDTDMIELLFDDHDTGLIKLDEIRLLPADYQIKGVNLEEWRISSFQIPTSISTSRRTCRRRLSSSSSLPTIQKNDPIKKPKKEKSSSSSSSSSDIVPVWTLNTRTSTITRDDTRETIHVGDCVILHGADQSISYIGKVLKFYRNRSTQQDLVRLQWYYSPEEIPKGHSKNNLPGALYESTHIDENPIATVRFKGNIYQSYDDYVKKTNHGKKRQKTEFYLVGHYDPTTGELTRYDKKSRAKTDD